MGNVKYRFLNDIYVMFFVTAGCQTKNLSKLPMKNEEENSNVFIVGSFVIKSIQIYLG